MPATSSTASGPVGYAHILRAILVGQPEGNLNTTARCTDSIIEVAPQPALANVVPLPDSPALLQCIEGLSRQVAVLIAERPHSSFKDPRPSSRNRCLGSRPPFRDDASSILCWYHCHCGAQGAKVYSSLCLPPARKVTQRKSMAAHVCTTSTGRLFIMDGVSER